MNRAPRKARSTNVLAVLMNVPRISNHLLSDATPGLGAAFPGIVRAS
jgi:hypothetical protein